MNPYLEIAVPLESKAITFFIGTGFSKYLTDGKAPSWVQLLESLARKIDDSNRTLHNKIFNTDEAGNATTAKLDPSICAQVLELEYKRKGLYIRKTIADIFREQINDRTINHSKVAKLKGFFKNYPDINFVTTNYDTLISKYILDGYPKVFVDGSPIPKSNLGQNIFHIHGCITKPSSIVFTINDYFRFQHRDSYLSRKFYTLLQETTVVILGYSLGDFNLNRIFNEAQVSRSVSLRRSDIYLVSRDYTDEIYNNFYSFTYGIQVIGLTEIDGFFDTLSSFANEAKQLVSEVENLRNVLDGTREYTNDFLKLGTSFNKILLQASTIGVNLSDPRLVKVLVAILQKKRELTGESGAWSQYLHFADWLIDLASIVDIQKSNIKDEYLKLAEHSFNTMRQELLLGWSWGAFTTWKNRFQEMKMENQNLLKGFIKSKYPETNDAHKIF